LAKLQLPIRSSIGAKIFGAFIAMSLITGALGAYGIYVLSAAGRIVVNTYDGPLMAINFARSASLTFTQMDKELLLRRTAAPAERVAIDQTLERLTFNFFEDLAVARQRSLAEDERDVIREIKEFVAQWDDLQLARRDDVNGRDLDALAKRIDERFDVLIELTTDHSFVERRKAVWAISRFEYTSVGMCLLALFLSAALTVLLARRIIRPLRAAAAAADRIARGELQTPIASGGKDETGILLRSLTVMQDSIRTMIERETAQRRSAQSRLIDALETSHEAMVLVDASGRIVHANSQVTRFFPEVSAHLVEGSEFSSVFSKVEELVPLVAAARLDGPSLLPAPLEQTEPLSSSGEFRLPDGRWVRVSRNGTQDGGFFLLVSDFTEIKQREESFREAKMQAEGASAAKSQFLANMSHELRTPLNAIIGFSEIISREMFGRAGVRQYVEYGHDILQSGRHLLDVINGVLDLAKSEAGKLELHVEDVDLGEALDACVAMVGEQCAAADLEFTATRPEPSIFLRGEAAKLRQIFINLLSNAIKFSEPGGRITLSTTCLNDGRVQVDVIDTGIGMRPEDVPLALSPFGQIDSRLARRYQGTGLGLPLTNALVELHGGTMTIDTALGRGTRVSVVLLRAMDCAIEAPARAVAKVSYR
jgi:signal transduction histidine kinase